MENKNHEILLGLTTTPNSDWRGKVEEIKKFNIRRIALFPTFLKIKERSELYALLDGIQDLVIPHVHLRNDMEKWELEMFEKKYKTEFFNIHGKHFVAYKNPPFDEYLPKIFIENQFYGISRKCLDMCGGLCLDFSHWESSRRKGLSLAKMVDELVDDYKIGCCHVSAIKTSKLNPYVWFYGYDCHYLKKNKEVDYMKKYKKYLPKYISLELENSFEKQLEVKKYIEENILTN